MASVEVSSHSFQSLRQVGADRRGSSFSTVLKLFLDLTLVTGYGWPKVGCLLLVSCLYFSVRALISLLVCFRAIPAVL